jgi:hypothetical protein
MKKHILSINGSENKFFIMDNTNDLTGKPIGKISDFFVSFRSASIEMLQMTNKQYTNIYDLSQKDYELLTSNRP